MKARVVYPDRGLVETVVWRVPEPIPPALHGRQYSLVHIVDGMRVIGYDDERGKGYHRHVGASEDSYVFGSIEKLPTDFITDVDRERSS